MKYSCKDRKTKNGATILFIDIPDTRTCEIAIATRSGYRTAQRDGVEKYETPHLLEHLVFEGSKKYPSSDELQDIFSKGGGASNGMTTPYHNVFMFHTRATYVKSVLSAAFDMIYHPLLEQKGFEEELAVVRNELDERMGDFANNASLYAQQQATSDTVPATDMQLGMLDNNTVDDARQYHAAYYTQANTQIVIAMDFSIMSESHVLALIERLFVDVPIGKRQDFPQYDTLPSVGAVGWVPIGKSIDESTLSMLFIKHGSATAKQRIAMNVFVAAASNMKTYSVNHILRKKGLAYGLDLSGSNAIDSTGLELNLSARNDKLPEILAHSLERIRILAEKGVSESQFASLKADMADAYEDAIESSSDIMNWYVDDYLVTGKLSHPEEDKKLLEKMTQSDVLKFTRDIISYQRMYAAVFSAKPKRVSNVIAMTAEAVLRDKKLVTDALVDELGVLLVRHTEGLPYRVTNSIALLVLGAAFTLPVVDFVFKSQTIAHQTYASLQYWMIAAVIWWIAVIVMTFSENLSSHKKTALSFGLWSAVVMGIVMIPDEGKVSILSSLNNGAQVHAGIVLLCIAILIIPNLPGAIRSLQQKIAKEQTV